MARVLDVVPLNVGTYYHGQKLLKQLKSWMTDKYRSCDDCDAYRPKGVENWKDKASLHFLGKWGDGDFPRSCPECLGKAFEDRDQDRDYEQGGILWCII